MNTSFRFSATASLFLFAGLVSVPSAHGHVKLGAGNASLIGGDLTDPTDTVKDKAGVNYGEGKSEEEMRPEGGA